MQNFNSCPLVCSCSQSASTEELAKMYGVAPGAKIHSVHHRQPPSVLSSTTSSSASVATNAGSTAALLHTARHKKTNKKKNLQSYYKQNYLSKNSVSKPKELNSLLHANAATNIFDNVKKKKDKQKKISTASQQQFFDHDSEEGYETVNARTEVKYKLQAEAPNYLPVVSTIFFQIFRLNIFLRGVHGSSKEGDDHRFN